LHSKLAVYSIKQRHEELLQNNVGQKSIYADECLRDGFIGADFDISVDLTNTLPGNWRDFNHQFIPIFLSAHPDKRKVAAGLACGMLWTIAMRINKGDIYEEYGELVGQQYPSDTGPIDILAVSKDKRELLVVELKEDEPVIML
jgi:hypothetical protein